jgi:hypothetical protein
MTTYIILLLCWGFFTLILNQLYKNRIKYNNKIYIIMAGGSLFLLMSLRHVSVGTDLIGYYYEYLNSELYLSLRHNELGYSYFNHFFRNIDVNFQLYLSIIALITVFSISKLYLKFSHNIMLSYYLFITLGLFGMTLTGLRQSLAIMITIFAYTSLMENKRLKFFILVGLATLFHNSAIIFIVIYFIKKIKITKRKGIVLYILTLLSFFIKDILITLVITISPERYIRKYLIVESGVNPIVILVYVAIPIAVLLVWNRDSMEEKIKESTSIMILMSLINIVIYFIAIDIPMVSRFSYYFMIYNTILLPNVIESIKSKDTKFIAKGVCIILSLIMFLMSTPGGSLGIDNYKFFWGEI